MYMKVQPVSTVVYTIWIWVLVWSLGSLISWPQRLWRNLEFCSSSVKFSYAHKAIFKAALLWTRSQNQGVHYLNDFINTQRWVTAATLMMQPTTDRSEEGCEWSSRGGGNSFLSRKWIFYYNSKGRISHWILEKKKKICNSQARTWIL